jgi:diguanylate cyclase (GGDEF)-like protein
MIGIVQDVTEARDRESRIRDEGYHDPLTGLYNRRFFEEELRRIDTPRLYPVSVLIAGVVGLRIQNELHGYQEGDRMLISAPGSSNCCRSEDVVARWSGSRFAVFLPNTDAKAQNA